MNDRVIAKNYIYNVLYQILTILIPLITTPYLSKTLGAENIGIYGYTLSIVTYFILFGSLGVGLYGQREIAYVRDDIEKRSKTFWEIFLLKFITLTISLITFYLAFCINNKYDIYYKILLLELASNIFDISWLFAGLEEFKKTVTRNTIIKLLSVLLIFVLIKSPEDLYKYFIIYVLSTFLGNLSLWMHIGIIIKKPKKKNLNIARHIKPTILLFIPQVAIQVYALFDKTMLGILTNDMSIVGNYEQSQKIVKTALVFVTSLGTVVAPRIANTISSGSNKNVTNYLKNSYHFVWLIGLPITMGIIGISKTLIPWFLGNEFIDSIPLVQIGSLLIMAIGLNNISGMQYLIPAKKQNLFTKSVVCAAIFNFIFNYIFIPKYGALGAIVASVGAETLIIIIQAVDIKKDIDLRIMYDGAIKYLIGSIIMLIPIYIIGEVMEPVMITTFLQFFVGLIVYCVYLLLIKDEFLYDFLNIIKSKISKRR